MEPFKGQRSNLLPKLGSADAEDIQALVDRIKEAKLPVLLLGMRASGVKETQAIRQLVAKLGCLS